MVDSMAWSFQLKCVWGFKQLQ